MSRDDLVLAMGICNFVLTWGVALYMYMTNKTKATNARIGKLEEDLSSDIREHSERLTHLETIAESAPTHGDIGKVYESLNTLAATVNQLVGENRGQTDTLRLILNRITEKGMQ